MTYLNQIKPHIATRTCSMALALTALAGGIALSPNTAAAQVGACVTIGEFTLCSNDQGVRPDLGGPIKPITVVDNTDPALRTYPVITKNGSREAIHVSFRPGAGNSNIARVCLVNNSGGTRSFEHGAPGINNLTPTRGATSCANFPTSYGGAFYLKAAGNQVQSPQRLVFNMTKYARGVLTILWQ